jgi:chromosome segregation ATPase
MNFGKEEDPVVVKFQEAMKKFDATQAEMLKLKSLIEEFSQQIKALAGFITDTNQILGEKINKMSSKIDAHENKHEQSKKDLECVAKDADHLETFLYDITGNLSEVTGQTKILAKAVEDLKQEQEKQLNMIHTMDDIQGDDEVLFNSFRERLKELEGDVQKLEGKYHGLSVVQYEMLDREKDQQVSFMALSKNVNALENKCNEMGQIAIKNSQDLRNSLEKIKVPDVSQFFPRSEFTATLENIMSKFESVSLDAKNAFLRSGNSSMQIDVINKKIENIQLLLKRHELNG